MLTAQQATLRKSSIGIINLVSLIATLPDIQKGLDSVEQFMLRQVDDYHPDLKTATSLILSSGGKRIRPRLSLLVGSMLNADFDRLVTLATAIEMLHTATLVHDDLIDGSLIRRGIATLNSKWSPAATVLTGDFLFASASEIASQTNSVKVMQIFARTLMTIVNGEVEQLFSARNISTIEEYHLRIYAKTASLFETSTQTAAVISNVENHQVEKLRKFGYELGMAFQIVDDILDYIGDASTVGKPVGGDLRQGLITLPVIYFAQLYPSDTIVRKLGNLSQPLNSEETEFLISAIANSDAIHRSQDDAAKFARRAENCLMEFPSSPEKDELLSITRFIIERDK